MLLYISTASHFEAEDAMFTTLLQSIKDNSIFVILVVVTAPPILRIMI